MNGRLKLAILVCIVGALLVAAVRHEVVRLPGLGREGEVNPASLRLAERSGAVENQQSDVVERKQFDSVEREPSDVVEREPSDVVEREPSDVVESLQNSTLPAHLVGAHQEDEALIEHIRKHMFVAPAPGPLKLEQPGRTHYSQIGQSKLVDQMLGKRRNGFFIECGAAQGEAFSNSLFFEKSRNWTGLLIEANPTYFETVRQKRRVNLVNGCLSPVPKATVLRFTVANMMGGLTNLMEKSHLGVITDKKRISGHVEVPCLPLYSILKALQISHVDYFSLDVEGPEVEILDTIPFDKITFDVLTVEFGVQRCPKCTSQKLQALNALMAKRGYKVHKVMGRQDVVYKRATQP